MKKTVSMLSPLILVIYIAFTFVGCGWRQTHIQLFTEGTYETEEGNDIKAKLIILPITEEEFENANGKNVIKNNSRSEENNIYYSFELFFYDDSMEDYVQVEISNLCHHPGRPSNSYDGEMECNSGNYELSDSFSFEYDSAYWVNIFYGEVGNTIDLLFSIVS